MYLKNNFCIFLLGKTIQGKNPKIINNTFLHINYVGCLSIIVGNLM